MGARRSGIAIAVADSTLQHLPKAKVSLKPLARRGGRLISLKYDPREQVYSAREVGPGPYLLRAEAAGLEPQEREVRVGPAGIADTVILGKSGAPFYYRGRVKVPFEPRRDVLAVSLKPAAQVNEESLYAFARELKLAVEGVADAIRRDNVRVFRAPARTSERAMREIQKRLAGHPLVDRAGPIVKWDKESISFLTDELIVKFRSQVSLSEIPPIARRFRLQVERPIPYAGNCFLMRAAEAGYQILKTCEDLVKSGRVEYAEPNLVITMVDDQVNPTDFLYAQQWHIPIVNLPQAWASLQGQNAPGVAQGDPGDLTFGRETIVIAVMDRGIQSQTVMGVTSPAHPDFTGNVTGGAAKIYKYFDFVNMVANNDAPPNDHGMGCAGVATALANNASVVPGENEGVAGAAPNCRVMGLIRPAGGTELQYSDAYIWMAGFNPQSAQAGFPAQISPGADVITNSFGESSGAAISGLMQDCFDYVTTYGRGGKGVVLCFSAGNGNTAFALQRPWAAYEKTLAVAASTNTDVRAGYSNYGNGIDLCAPSSDGIGIVSCDLPAGGNLAGHTGGAMDYRNNFGGTSSATPLVAGVAALLLSARPQLTWVETRQILRDTAVQIDAANVDPIGQWVDTDGDAVTDYSQWYGNGRLDAQAAVDAAIACTFDRDILVRDNLADVGTVPVAGTFWGTPDAWVRNTDPAVDGAAALPASYASAPPHQSPIAGQDNWVWVRFKSIGIAAAYPFYIRAYLTHWAGFEFAYPDDFIPTVRPSDPVPVPLTPGTYLLGETRVDTLAAGADGTVNILWPQALVPPQTVMVDGSEVTWHPCLLVEISPQDGPTPTGAFVWDNNNLAQRNLSIVYPDDDGAFASGSVMGNRRNRFSYLELLVDRSAIPAEVELYVKVLDRRVLDRLRKAMQGGHRTVDLDCCRLTFLDPSRLEIACASNPAGGVVLTLPKNARLDVQGLKTDWKAADFHFTFGFYKGREVLWLPAHGEIRIPIFAEPGALIPIVLGGVVRRKLPKGTYRAELSQRDPAGRVIGAVAVELTIRE